MNIKDLLMLIKIMLLTACGSVLNQLQSDASACLSCSHLQLFWKPNAPEDLFDILIEKLTCSAENSTGFY
jgi:hypothetical protein